MRRLALLFLAFAANFVATARSDEEWTLRAALDAARAHSPEAALATARLDRAQALADQAAAPGLPQVTVHAAYTQTNNPMLAFGALLNQGAFRPGIDFNAPGQVDNLQLAGTVAYSLYSGGHLTSTRAAARSGIAASEHDRAAAFARLDAAVARAYFVIRQTRETVAALDAALATYTETLRIARLRLDAGQLLKSEVLNLEVQLAQTREHHLAARQQATLAERHFLYLLGQPPVATTPVALAAEDPAIATLTAPVAPTIAARPELHALTARRAAAAAQVDAAVAGRRPRVNAFASYQLDHGWRLDGDGDSWIAGLSADWAVFDGRATTGRITEARATLAETEAAQRQLELGLQLELEQARLAHTFAAEQLAVTGTLVAQAEEAARISRERFEAGSLLTVELIAVETRLTEARMRRAVATAAERIATVTLRQAAALPIL